jgi:hypothetical protein
MRRLFSLICPSIVCLFVHSLRVVRWDATAAEEAARGRINPHCMMIYFSRFRLDLPAAMAREIILCGLRLYLAMGGND